MTKLEFVKMFRRVRELEQKYMGDDATEFALIDFYIETFDVGSVNDAYDQLTNIDLDELSGVKS